MASSFKTAWSSCSSPASSASSRQFLGGIFASLGIGGLVGAVLAGPATRRLGLGATILGCLGLWAVDYGVLAFISAAPFAPILLGAVGATIPSPARTSARFVRSSRRTNFWAA